MNIGGSNMLTFDVEMTSELEKKTNQTASQLLYQKSTLAFVCLFDCFLMKICFQISDHNSRARSGLACQNLKLTGQMSDDWREFIGSSVPLIPVVKRVESTLHWISHYPLDNSGW